MGCEDPKPAASVVVAPSRPPKPRVSNSPRPQAAASPVPRVGSSPRVASSPRLERPPVTPGTPLMSHRASTPRRPRSARWSSADPPVPRAVQKSDGKICIYIYNVHSADRVALRMLPDLPVGPASSSSTSAADNTNTPCEDSEDARSSLKAEIAKVFGIQLQQVRLTFRGSPISDNEKTLKCYGITEGETVHVRIQRAHSAGRDDVLLACPARKSREDLEQHKDEKLWMRSFGMQSLTSQARIKQRCSENDAVLLPKWISEEQPHLFAPVGVGIDGHGEYRAYEEFSDKGIWIPPVDHPNHRGQGCLNQYGMQRVRESAHAGFGGA